MHVALPSIKHSLPYLIYQKLSASDRGVARGKKTVIWGLSQISQILGYLCCTSSTLRYKVTLRARVVL